MSNGLSQRICVFCSGSDSQNLIAGVLEGCDLKFITDPNLLTDGEYISTTFKSNGIDTLILSNLGIPIDIVKRHLSLLPEDHEYKVLLILSYTDNEIREYCSAKNIQAVKLPFDIEQFRKIVIS